MKGIWHHKVHILVRGLPYSPKVASELYPVITQ